MNLYHNQVESFKKLFLNEALAGTTLIDTKDYQQGEVSTSEVLLYCNLDRMAKSIVWFVPLLLLILLSNCTAATVTVMVI